MAITKGVKITNLSKLVTVEKTQTADDGTTKFLLRLVDGETIECVLLGHDGNTKGDYEKGHTVCISSQVGCKMKCFFCASGECGFIRNLTAEEMLAQVMVAKKHATVTHLTVMGVGEPLDNFDEVIKFCQMVDIGARRISLSTCGLPDKIREFADLGMGVNLCISLHAPNDIVRRKIMPIARRYSMHDVFMATKYFFQKTRRRVTFEYTMIDGVNCDVIHAQELGKRLKNLGIALHVNLISMNGNVGGLSAPNNATGKIFMDTLIKSGISVTWRKSRGGEIAGACGQLRSQKRKNPTLSISLDPAIKDGRLSEYLTEVNSWAKHGGLSIHLDVMRKQNVGHDRCTEDEIKYVMDNAKLPVFRHDVTREPIQYQGDRVYVMSVTPGESGREFQPRALEDIKKLRAQKKLIIISDGGINNENIAQVRDAGADEIVVGAFIYKQPSRKAREESVKELLAILHK